jgi:sec-independent protein translocase protein TatA
MFRNPTTDLLVVLVIVLLIFGPKRLPSLGKQLGSSMREFKDSITRHHDREDEDERRPELSHVSPPPVAAPSDQSNEVRQPAEAAPARGSSESGSDRSS